MAGRSYGNVGYFAGQGKTIPGDVCLGILLGTRLAMVGVRVLGMDPLAKNRDLIVFIETDRCVTDAVQAVTGRSLGHRTLKFINYQRRRMFRSLCCAKKGK